MIKEQTSYGVQAQEVCELFSDYIKGDPMRPCLVISTQGINDASATAIEKSLTFFGYHTPAWSLVQLAPAHADCSLDENAALPLIEGIDPLRMICTDSAAMEVLAAAYRVQLAPNSIARLWGRTAAIFADFDALISTDAGKHTAWKLLKLLQ